MDIGTIEALEKGWRRQDRKEEARWGYAMYVADNPAMYALAYFFSQNPLIDFLLERNIFQTGSSIISEAHRPEPLFARYGQEMGQFLIVYQR